MKSRLATVPMLAAAVLAPGNWASSSNDAPIELKLEPYAGALRALSGRVAARELRFLFDTGGGATILSLASAQSVGCEPFGRASAFRHDGERVDGRRGGPLELTFGAFRRRGEVGVVDLDAMLAGRPPVGGVASLESFAGHTITLELGRDRLFVENAVSFESRRRSGHELVSRIARQAAGATLDVFVAVEGRHGPLWFELDSANVAPVQIAPHAFVELGFAAPDAGKTTRVEIQLLGLGAVACDVAAKEMIYDGLLNADFCSRYALTFDLATGRTWAAPNR